MLYVRSRSCENDCKKYFSFVRCYFILCSISRKKKAKKIIHSLQNDKQPPEVLCKNRVLRNLANSQENTCARLRPATFLKKDTLAPVLSCKFCTSFKNTFFYRALLHGYRCEFLSLNSFSVKICEQTKKILDQIMFVKATGFESTTT